MLRPSLSEYVLGGALIVAIAFGGWNWYRKNVYYDRLQTKSAQLERDADKASDDMQRAANLAATQVMEKRRAREADLQKQLDYLTDNPVVRTEYVVRERWRSGTCPTGTAGTDGDVPGSGSGLHPELERYALRAFGAADGVVEERNLCVAMYNRAAATLLEWRKKHGR